MNAKIHPTAIIGDNVKIGSGSVIHPYAIIGTDAENKYSEVNEKTGGVVIGNNTIIREGVTINAPIDDMTVVGNNCYLMAKSHIGHDGKLGDNVTMSTNAIVGGHSIIRDYSVLGLNSVIHQKRYVGEFSMVGMLTPISNHVPPFLISYGNPGTWHRVNEFGMKRHGYDQKMIDVVKDYYRYYFYNSKNTNHKIFKHQFTRIPMVDFINYIGKDKIISYGGSAVMSTVINRRDDVEYSM